MNLLVHGSRPSKFGGYAQPNPISQYVADRIRTRLTNLGPYTVLIGGDLGVPQWTAIICKELGIPYHVYVPFKDFSSKWPPNTKQLFNQICAGAGHVHVVSQGGYSSGVIFKRNEYMVKMADQVLLFWDGSPGVTEHVSNCAKARNKTIIEENLPDHLRVDAAKIYAQLQQKKMATSTFKAFGKQAGNTITFSLDDSPEVEKENQEKLIKMLGLPSYSNKKEVDPWAMKEEDAPVEEREPETLSQRLAPKRVVEID